MNNTWLRRAVTIPGFLLATLLMLATLPLWLPLSLLAALLFPRARSAPRCLGFFTAYLLCETVGIVVSALIWLRYRPLPGMDHRAYLQANTRLQHWWAGALKRSVERLFLLTFEIQGTDALHGDGAILLLRHASIGDTVVPVVFFATPLGKRVRYVLKRELLFDPCLDIVGSRLPNYFVDRFSDNIAREVEGLRRLTDHLEADESILIYPEGTRFSAAKRQHIIDSLEARGDADGAQRARRWTHLLPPRPAGTLALLEANPGRDLLLCAHTGFEGSSHFSTLFNGAWVRSHVRIRFWRVPFSAIPRDREAQREFLFRLWDQMNDAVVSLSGDHRPATGAGTET